MRTISELLDQVKAARAIPSDYKLAMYLGVSQGTVQNWRHQRSLPDQRATAKIAAELQIDPDVLILEIEAQRAPSDFARLAWLRIAERLQAGTVHVALAFVVAFLALLGTSPNAHATVTDLSASVSKSSVYYVKYRKHPQNRIVANTDLQHNYKA